MQAFRATEVSARISPRRVLASWMAPTLEIERPQATPHLLYGTGFPVSSSIVDGTCEPADQRGVLRALEGDDAPPAGCDEGAVE